MSFRYFEWGKYTDENVGNYDRQLHGRSIILWGATVDADYGASNETTGAVEINSIGGTDGIHKQHLLKSNLVPVKAKLGQAPIIINATWTIYHHKTDSAFTGKLEIYRLIQPAGFTTATSAIRDTGVPWAHSAYTPLPGEDHRSAAIWDDNCLASTGNLAFEPLVIADVTEELAYCLRAGIDWEVVFRTPPGTTTSTRYNTFGHLDQKPFFSVAYLNPIEFYEAHEDGTIDLEAIAIESEDLADSLYLGAHQRGDVGTPVKVFAKNLSETVFALVEIWDDFPEWTDITHPTGSGTGGLDYVVPGETAVSQRYTIDFSSATEYEIKAEAFRDYTTSLHPQIDSDPDWQGSTGSDFTAPSPSGLSIPAAAWQPEDLTAADSFEVLILGNTTDTGWPADSNDMVEITQDSGNAPVAADWRPIAGQRTRLRVAVDIDATTKKLYPKPIIANRWIVGDQCFVGDATNLDEGQVKSVAEAEIGALANDPGNALDDVTISGNYNGTVDDVLRVEIDGNTPDTYKWSLDDGVTWEETLQTITAATPMLLQNGVWITINATTGHTIGDGWESVLTPWTIEVEGLTSGSISYAIGARVGTTLPYQSLAKSIHGQTNVASGASEAQPHRIYMDDPVTLGFVVGRAVTITSPDASLKNTKIIASGGVTSTYIELTSNLTEDFVVGSFVMQVGEGEMPFWLRVIASNTSVEQLKQLRINTRT